MLLLNFVRALITVLGLLLVETFRRAYDLEAVGLLLVLGLVLFVVFCVCDVSEEALIRYFNRDDEKI